MLFIIEDAEQHCDMRNLHNNSNSRYQILQWTAQKGFYARKKCK